MIDCIGPLKLDIFLICLFLLVSLGQTSWDLGGRNSGGSNTGTPPVTPVGGSRPAGSRLPPPPSPTGRGRGTSGSGTPPLSPVGRTTPTSASTSSGSGNEKVPYNTEDMNEVQKEFDKYRRTYGIEYPSQEETQRRLEIFRASLMTINSLNGNERGTATYAINQWADQTKEEFRLGYMGYRSPRRRRRRAVRPPLKSTVPNKVPGLPVKSPLKNGQCFDWAVSSFMPPIENQGKCAASYAFGAVGLMEILFSALTKKVTRLSKEQIVECTASAGCKGATAEMTVPLLKKGLVSEADYPYTLMKGGSGPTACELNKVKNILVQMQSLSNVMGEDKMAAALPTSPVAIAINAEDPSFRFYKGGIIEQCSIKNPAALPHLVIIVGCRTDTKVGDYWVIKNSWGTTWGVQGYAWIKKGAQNCGIGKEGFTMTIAQAAKSG